MGALPLATAQTYPSRAVRVIIPFSAGGAADVPLRILGQRLSDVIKQQVVIENRPGAGSTIGAEVAAKSPPDGYNLFMISNTHFVSAALYKKLAYDALNDYTPITQITNAPNVLVVHPSLPAKSVKELIALAKARPNQIDFASSGNGSTQKFIKTGKLRALGVSGGRRSAELADVPTIAEAGVPGYEMVSWFGMAAPKGLARDVQMRLHSDLLRVLKNPDFQKSMRAAGQEVAFQDTPEKFYDFMKIEAVKWARVVADSGARVE